MAYVLAVDDEQDVLNSIRVILEDDGHEVAMASDGQEALAMIARSLPDLVILDIIMPEMDGTEVCRRIRADPVLRRLPIMFLTAKSRPHDVVKGLDAGGDDYLTKPFEIIELPARVRALLRRIPGGALDPDAEYYEVGALRLHTSRPQVEVNDRLIELTPTEHHLLHKLMLHAGQPVSTAQLLEDVWGYPPGVGDPRLVRVHITNLRAKLESQPDSPEYIQNIHGRGYLIAQEVGR